MQQSPMQTRVWREFRAGTLTRAHRDVVLTLWTFRGRGGACWPSHETLAERARCSVRTVQRALAAASGIVAWTHRRVRVGWRWLRISNSYTFHPSGVVHGKPVKPTTGQRGREGESKKEYQGLVEAMTAPDWQRAATANLAYQANVGGIERMLRGRAI